jgi:tRNA(Arg) A34 adenosine deaminase TadA
VNVASHEKLNHRVTVEGGVLEEEAAQMLRAFFKERRAEELS